MTYVGGEGQGGKLQNTVIGESSKGRGKPSKADGEVAVAEVGRKPGTKELAKVKRQKSLEKWEVVNSFNR